MCAEPQEERAQRALSRGAPGALCGEPRETKRIVCCAAGDRAQCPLSRGAMCAGPGDTGRRCAETYVCGRETRVLLRLRRDCATARLRVMSFPNCSTTPFGARCAISTGSP